MSSSVWIRTELLGLTVDILTKVGGMVLSGCVRSNIHIKISFVLVGIDTALRMSPIQLSLNLRNPSRSN